MKTNLKLMTVVAVMGALVQGLFAAEVTVRPLTVNEAALQQATHVATITGDDLAAFTEVAGAVTNTWTVTEPCMVELVSYQLVRAFSTTNDAVFTNTLSLTIGDGTDADLFLLATEMASDGTEVWLKGPPVPRVEVTNALVTAYGSKVYTSDDTVDFLITPSATQPISNNENGEVQVFFIKRSVQDD